jgi:release factor glutamine methyltransferase
VIDRWIAEAARAIREIGAGNPRFEAELLLAQAIERPRAFLFTHPEYVPAEKEQACLNELLGRRLSGEPLQYVLGTAAFRELTLRVGPGVLIPRSETEVLVGIVWDALRLWRQGAGRRTTPTGPGQGREKPWVIDVGVGSGAILLALVHEALHQLPAEGAWPGPGPLWFNPLGIDLSPVALGYTVDNARLNGLPRPMLVQGDLLSAVRAPCVPGGQVAAIVSNPPYITTAEMTELAPEIREHEPPVALHGGVDGLGVIRRLLDEAGPFVRQGALLGFEIGATQEAAVGDELARRGLGGLATIHPDLAGRPRVVMVEPR